jgi:hypothetical protein
MRLGLLPTCSLTCLVAPTVASKTRVYYTWGIASLGGPTFVDTLPNLVVPTPYNSIASSTAAPSWTTLRQLHNGLHSGGKQPPSFTKTQSERYSLRYNIPSSTLSPSDSEAWVKEKNHRHKNDSLAWKHQNKAPLKVRGQNRALCIFQHT